MKNQNPIEFIKKILAIIGHNEKEQAEYAEMLYSKIIQASVITLMPKLTVEQQGKVKEMFEKGKQMEEVMTYLIGATDEKMLTEHISAVSYKAMQDYMNKVVPSLTSEQKTKLSELFLGQSV